MSEDQGQREMTLTERIHLAGEQLTATDEKDIDQLKAVVNDLLEIRSGIIGLPLWSTGGLVL